MDDAALAIVADIFPFASTFIEEPSTIIPPSVFVVATGNVYPELEFCADASFLQLSWKMAIEILRLKMAALLRNTCFVFMDYDLIKD